MTEKPPEVTELETPQTKTAAAPDPPESHPSLSGSRANLDMLMEVPLQITVELGRTRMTLRQALDLEQGSVIELERLAGEAVDVYINERMIARGEVVVVDDKFGVRITELVPEKEKNGNGNGGGH